MNKTERDKSKQLQKHAKNLATWNNR